MLSSQGRFRSRGDVPTSLADAIDDTEHPSCGTRAAFTHLTVILVNIPLA